MFRLFSSQKKRRIHFLHIGKTGGSAVKSVLVNFQNTPNYELILHRHRTSLKDVPKGDSVIFFLRDPVSRFISGFYSRQRKGKPRYYAEWNRQEKKVFEHFSTPNELATALANKQSDDHGLAIMAMKSVKHFAPYKNWYVDLKYFQSRLEDILFVGFQESLNADFLELERILEIPQENTLPTDDIGAHRNPTDLDKSIDEKGVLALTDWYSDDYTFVDICKEIMSNKEKTHRQ